MIIAVDFDGVLCEDRFPDIGPPNQRIIDMIRMLSRNGYEIILWTCRVEQQLEQAIAWCKEHGLEFCAVNDNAPSNKAKYAGVYTETPRKVYADVYVDDHNLDYRLYSRVYNNSVVTNHVTDELEEVLSWKEEK